MDITLFIFFILFGFICMLSARIFRNSGLGSGVGVIGMFLFLILGFAIGGGEQQITSLQIIAGNATPVPLELGIAASDLAIMLFALAILTLFVGIL